MGPLRGGSPPPEWFLLCPWLKVISKHQFYTPISLALLLYITSNFISEGHHNIIIQYAVFFSWELD